MLDQAGEHSVTYEEFFNWLRSGERFENINDSKFGKLCQAMEIFKPYDTDNSDTLDGKQFENLIASSWIPRREFGETFQGVGHSP